MQVISVRKQFPENGDCWEYRGKHYAYNAQATGLFLSNSGHHIPAHIRERSLLVPVLLPNQERGNQVDQYSKKRKPNYYVFTEIVTQ